MDQSKSTIKFNHKAIKATKIYALHQAFKNGEECYVKVFDQKIVSKYELDEALEFNIQVLLTECQNLIYPDAFLPIEATCNQSDAVVLVMKPFGQSLDQFLKQNPPRPQHQALKIFQQILKAVYSLIMAGYWHRNLRAEHFVKVNNKWKLQSIVYDQRIGKMGMNSQYLYNAEYQPPQAYERPNFTQQELDQRIVWDLGCILIHLLTGSHKLKNQVILSKFKDCPFSFKKLQAKIEDKLSSQLKQLLGQMCHYDSKKRIPINELILNGFFSKQIAAHYSKHKQSRKQTIFVGSSSSISQSIQRTANQYQIKIQGEGAQTIAENLIKVMQKQIQTVASSNGNKIQKQQKFKDNMKSIIEQQQPQSSIVHKNKQKQQVPNIRSINNQQLNDIIELYKNYLDKGQILGIGAKKFEQMLALFPDKQLGRQLVTLTQYAVNFVKTMDYSRLAKFMNENKSFFDIKSQKFEKFHGSPEYKALKIYVNYKQKQAKQQFLQLKTKLVQSKNSFIKQKQILKIFVQKSDPEECQFADIKQAYRKILKLSYDLIAQCYTTNKTVQWARLGMYITYCLAIDKFYIPQEFQNNFKYFFNWSKKPSCNYVSVYDFQNYLDNAPRTDLVQNSRYIMQRFYEI